MPVTANLPAVRMKKIASRIRQSTSWIVFSEQGDKGKCERCREVLLFNMPMRIEIWQAAVNAFVKIHRGCKQRIEGF